MLGQWHWRRGCVTSHQLRLFSGFCRCALLPGKITVCPGLLNLAPKWYVCAHYSMFLGAVAWSSSERCLCDLSLLSWRWILEFVCADLWEPFVYPGPQAFLCCAVLRANVFSLGERRLAVWAEGTCSLDKVPLVCYWTCTLCHWLCSLGLRTSSWQLLLLLSSVNAIDSGWITRPLFSTAWHLCNGREGCGFNFGQVVRHFSLYHWLKTCVCCFPHSQLWCQNELTSYLGFCHCIFYSATQRIHDNIHDSSIESTI